MCSFTHTMLTKNACCCRIDDYITLFSNQVACSPLSNFQKKFKHGYGDYDHMYGYVHDGEYVSDHQAVFFHHPWI